MNPLPIYLRDSSDSQLGIAGVAADTPDMVPVAGFRTLRVFGRSPTDTWTLAVYGILKANGTAVLIDTLTCPVGGALDEAIDLGAYEFVKLVLTNGATAQRPEVRVVLEPEQE